MYVAEKICKYSEYIMSHVLQYSSTNEGAWGAYSTLTQKIQFHQFLINIADDIDLFITLDLLRNSILPIQV